MTRLNRDVIWAGMVFVLVAVVAYGGYSFYILSLELESAEKMIEQSELELAELRENMESEVSDLEKEISELQEDRRILVEAYESEQQQTEEFQREIGRMSGELEDFRKLQDLDEELLRKYSTTYFLSENYEPPLLRRINEEYLCDGVDEQEIRSEVLPFLRDMLNAARNAGIDICVVSGFRSFDKQEELKSKYVVIYGEDTANSFSAEQGYSEHQLGTAVDFSTSEIGRVLDGFENTEAYEWLLDSAFIYGFILSYHEESEFYVFEPWHWRFVGAELAGDLHHEQSHFYDLNQRFIDRYLLNIFD